MEEEEKVPSWMTVLPITKPHLELSVQKFCHALGIPYKKLRIRCQHAMDVVPLDLLSHTSSCHMMKKRTVMKGMLGGKFGELLQRVVHEFAAGDHQKDHN